MLPLRLESVAKSIRKLPDATVWHLETRSLTIYKCVCVCFVVFVFRDSAFIHYIYTTRCDIFEEDVEFMISDEMPKSSKSKNGIRLEVGLFSCDKWIPSAGF